MTDRGALAALFKAVERLGITPCENLHHTENDYHNGHPCPVERRFDEAFRTAKARLAAEPEVGEEWRELARAAAPLARIGLCLPPIGDDTLIYVERCDLQYLGRRFSHPSIQSAIRARPEPEPDDA